jgi:hypothetical protein
MSTSDPRKKKIESLMGEKRRLNLKNKKVGAQGEE